MTNRREEMPDPADIGDTEEKLDHTGGGEALNNEVTPADEDYYRRHRVFDDADGEDAQHEPRGEPSRVAEEKASPVKGNTGTVAITGNKRGGT